MRRNLFATTAVVAVAIGVLTPVQSLAGPTALPGKTQGNGPCATNGNANSQIQSTKNNKKDCVTLAAPAFTLSASSETRTVNTLATGFTVASTGGPIASFAISPSAPSGMSFNTTTGAFAGTPTSVSATINYTITATNATGSTTRTFTFTVTAAPSATYSATTFTEAAANDGSITETLTITLSAGLVFTHSTSTELALGRVGNVPVGLTASLRSGSDRTFATLTFTGTATAHSNANDITNLTITFFDEDFTPNGVPSGANRSDLAIDFANPAVYNIGDTGPGGGIVYYVSSSPFPAPGALCSPNCLYLEVAPSGWSGNLIDPSLPFALPEYQNTYVAATGVDIGTGYANTSAIVSQNGICNLVTGCSYAAGAASAYRGGSKSDWYLPSQAESQILALVNFEREALRSLLKLETPGDGYWNSWAGNPDAREYATDTVFTLLPDSNNGLAGGYKPKSTSYYVRPIRAF